MKYIYRKIFFDYENEERWLNEMSKKGLMLSDFTWGKYTFEECKPDMYIYKMELLKEPYDSPESMDYITALESSGVEVIASQMRWIYMRKRKSDGPFEKEYDRDFRSKHYEKVFLMSFIFMIINIAIGISNILIFDRTDYGIFSLMIGIIMVLIGCVVGYSNVIPIYKKLKKIKKESK